MRLQGVGGGVGGAEHFNVKSLKHAARAVVVGGQTGGDLIINGLG